MNTGSSSKNVKPAPVAQWTEQVPSKHKVVGSSPAGGARWFLTILLVCVLLSSASLRPAQAQTGGGEDKSLAISTEEDGSSPFVTGEILVRMKPGTPAARSQSLLAQVEGTRLRNLYASDVELWRVPVGHERASVVVLEKETVVDFAELNYVYSVVGTDTVPNDPYYNKQWSMQKTQAEGGWDYGTGSSSIVVAILDTGIDETHPDLTGKIVAGYDFVNNDNNPHDGHGHGTHVAGIATATGNNGVGITGVSWKSSIMPVQICNSSGSCPDANIIDGINWAYSHGAKVINLSLGGSNYSSAMQQAVNNAHAAGSLVVAAAGNSGKEEEFYPAALNNVLAVSATNNADVKSDYSTYGNFVDVAAPGGQMGYYHDPGGIYSTMPTYNVTLTTSYSYSKNYDYLEGTSMASPFVAGLASLVWSLAPGLTPDEIQNSLQATATDLGSPGYDNFYGHGRVNVQAAMAYIAPPAAPVLNVITNPSKAPDYSLSWNTVAGAITYEVEEDDNASFSTPTQRYNGVDASFNVTGQAPGMWYYRVRGYKNSPGAWSNIQSTGVVPGIPSLAAISNPSQSDTYSLNWSSVPGAEGYRLEEDDNASFTSPVTRYHGPTTSYAVSGQSSGTWYYRVLADNIAGEGAWSSSRSTMVTASPLQAPVLSSIVNPEQEKNYSISWSAVNGASGYILEQSSTPYFETPVVFYEGAELHFDVTDQVAGTWYYRVRATSGADKSPWSATQTTQVTGYMFLPIVSLTSSP